MQAASSASRSMPSGRRVIRGRCVSAGLAQTVEEQEIARRSPPATVSPGRRKAAADEVDGLGAADRSSARGRRPRPCLGCAAASQCARAAPAAPAAGSARPCRRWQRARPRCTAAAGMASSSQVGRQRAAAGQQHAGASGRWPAGPARLPPAPRRPRHAAASGIASAGAVGRRRSRPCRANRSAQQPPAGHRRSTTVLGLTPSCAAPAARMDVQPRARPAAVLRGDERMQALPRSGRPARRRSGGRSGSRGRQLRTSAQGQRRNMIASTAREAAIDDS